MSLHIELAETLVARHGAHFEAPPELAQDAIVVHLTNGVRLEVRYAAADAYALRWTWGDAELAIDTAPTHPGLATAPNHFHTADGQVVADTITRCGLAPEENLAALIETLLRDPLLAAPRAET